MFDQLQALMSKRYPSEVRLLIEGGQLVDNWTNVARHCLIQAMAAEVISDLLGLDEQAKRKLASVAVAHDWRKRLDKCPDAFPTEEVERAAKLAVSANLDKTLMDALTPCFLLRVLSGQATFLELVQFYIDDITLNDKIVLFEDRIAEVERRNPDPEPLVSKQLSKPYWDVEREIGHRIEDMLFWIMNARYVKIGCAAEIPALIMAEIKKRVVS